MALCTRSYLLTFVVFLLRSIVFTVALEQEMTNKQAFSMDITLHRCKAERGLSSRSHEEWLNRLQGKRLVFIGDSITRYQYLELAFFLTYGHCPDQEPSEFGYILSERDYPGWDAFFKNSSDVLNVDTPPRHTREICLCSRTELMPRLVTERRQFTYDDIEGRRIELMFLQYFNEKFDFLEEVVAMAESMQPTDLVMNFGAWLRGSDPKCGWTKRLTSGPDWDLPCPPMKWLCDFLKSKHSFRTWWLTTTPRLEDDGKAASFPKNHHLSVPTKCKLPRSQVLDREVVINILQPDALLQQELWWDPVHMHADANHAFNRQLVSRLPEESATSPQEQHQRGIWKHLFSKGR